MSDDFTNKAGTMMIELNQSVARLCSKMDVLSSGIDGIKTDVIGVAEDISKIKEAMYNPDEGLYARQAQLEARIHQLEGWKAANNKVLWTVAGLTIALLLNSLWGIIVTGP
jgi:hypothetical protein